MKFEFPDLFPKEKTNQLSEDLKGMEKEVEFGKLREIRKNFKNRRHNVNNWFSI